MLWNVALNRVVGEEVTPGCPCLKESKVLLGKRTSDTQPHGNTQFPRANSRLPRLLAAERRWHLEQQERGHLTCSQRTRDDHKQKAGEGQLT